MGQEPGAQGSCQHRTLLSGPPSPELLLVVTPHASLAVFMPPSLFRVARWPQEDWMCGDGVVPRSPMVLRPEGTAQVSERGTTQG